ESVFGQIEGSNDLVNQRLTGEINLDGFEVSHTKDDIQWMGDEEDQVQDQLKEICADYRDSALKHRSTKDPGSGGPSELDIQTGLCRPQPRFAGLQRCDQHL
ncbi:MAG: hypothetical protein ACRDVP_07720, partial [Acidimicrobiales bacterium]